jgi:hypothetical protein
MIKNWQIVASAIVATLAILAVLGFNSPANADAKVEKRLDVVEMRLSEQAVINAENKKDLSHIKEGVDDIRGMIRRGR